MLKRLQIHSTDTVYIFALLGVIFIPFPFRIFDFNLSIISFLFENMTTFLIKVFFQKDIINTEITSDSSSLYVLVLLLFIIAFIFVFLLSFLKKWRPYRTKAIGFIQLVLSYYLALMLFKYGFDKVFKSQFYLPEPNTLYTPLGQMDKDLIYWSSMGLSYTYTVFSGLLEILPATLLLFKKTRTLGTLIAFGVLINVVAINLGFDISVKVFSTFLLFLSFLLLLPQLKSLFHFFIFKKPTLLHPERLTFSTFYHPFTHVAFKIFVIGFILLEAIYPHFEHQNFNDDLAPRPYLHGAYEVLDMKTIPDSISISRPLIKRFFIHRQGYLIFQNQNDQMQDFKLEIDSINHQFMLTDYDLNEKKYVYQHQEDTLIIEYFHQNQIYLLEATATDWKNLPALQNDFHWTVD